MIIQNECVHIVAFYTHTYIVTCFEGHVQLITNDDFIDDSFLSPVGRVEICLNGKYGTICGDGWSDEDASVVCRQLGFSSDGEFFVLLCLLQLFNSSQHTLHCTHIDNVKIYYSNCRGNTFDSGAIWNPSFTRCANNVAMYWYRAYFT